MQIIPDCHSKHLHTNSINLKTLSVSLPHYGQFCGHITDPDLSHFGKKKKEFSQSQLSVYASTCTL